MIPEMSPTPPTVTGVVVAAGVILLYHVPPMPYGRFVVLALAASSRPVGSTEISTDSAQFPYDFPLQLRATSAVRCRTDTLAPPLFPIHPLEPVFLFHV